MAVRVEANAEPIPGYRLIERLGGGGFGEVWKAEAPGGLFKAIKFVFGDLQAIGDEDGSRAEQELKALSRVKSVHHPYILSLERFDIIDGQLMIVMELADRTLWDRFRECRQQGLPGIPRDELLSYLEETSEALDLMIGQYQLQHLDIKPQNLFLVYHHVKVADFGLVKDLEGMAATVTGGVTPVYAAPETFDGWVSRFSDQYSLAIVYQELLTGERPFTGSTIRQLVLQHLQGAPNLKSLPLADQPVIARALSKNPDERYPSCQEMMRALREATRTAPVASAPAAPPRQFEPRSEVSADAGRLKADVAAPAVSDDEKTVHARRLPEERKAAAAKEPAQAKVHVDAKAAETPEGLNEAVSTELSRQAASAVAASAESEGLIQPALVIGLGKMGLQALQHFSRLLHPEGVAPENFPVRLLGIDTDPDAVQAASQGNHPGVLRLHEVLLARLHRPGHYLKPRPGRNPLEGWLNSKLLYRIPRQQNHAGLRALGRLAFVDNYRIIARRIAAELADCYAAANQHDTHGPQGVRRQTPRVYVVASLAGNTGGGMFLDMGYAVRRLLREQGHVQAEVIGLFLLPPATGETPHPGQLANAYAALTELNHYASGEVPFSAYYDTGESTYGAEQFRDHGAPFQRCLFLTWPDRSGKGRHAIDAGMHEAVQQAGRFLHHDIAGVMGKAAEPLRRQFSLGMSRSCQYETFGLYRLFWPRRQIRRRAARALCRRLVERWISKDAQALSEAMQRWAQEHWESQALRAEDLILQHRERCEQALKISPEKLVVDALQPLAGMVPVAPPPANPAAPVTFNPGPVLRVLEELEKLLGTPVENPGPLLPEPGLIEKALEGVAAAVADDCEQKIAELAVQLIEEPHCRLAGAEEALRQFSSLVEQALCSQETLAKELQERCRQLYQRLHIILENPTQAPTQSSSLWKFSRKPTQAPANPVAELVDLVQAFAKARFQSLILGHVTSLYVSLRGHLSDQIREVGFCRQRLKDLSDLVTEKSSALDALDAADAREKSLLPTGCFQLEDAVTQLDKNVSNDDLMAFDQRVQALIREHFRALVQVCMGSVNLVRSLAPIMLAEGEAFLDARLEGTHVGDIFLAQYPEDERQTKAQQDLFAAFEAAAPQSPRESSSGEMRLVAVPASAGERFAALVSEALPGVKLVPSTVGDEIVFLREFFHLKAADLEQLGPIAQEIYRKYLAKDPAVLHTREDVPQWQPAVPIAATPS